MPTTKASRNVTVVMTAAARGRSPAAGAVVREAIVVDLGLVDQGAQAARAMSSEAREDLIKIAAVREDLAVVADSADRVREDHVRRIDVMTIAIAHRVRPSRRGKWW